MRIINTIELKQIQFDVLKQVHKFCKENGIRYYLAYGTLLGAVRHKGYIPWDDDIDIVMPREDYMQFIETFQSERYKIYSPENNAKCVFTFAKIFDNNTVLKEQTNLPIDVTLGINIDLFPLEKISNKTEANDICKKIQRYFKLYVLKKIFLYSDMEVYKKIILYVCQNVLQCITFQKLVNKICAVAQKDTMLTEYEYIGQLVFPVYGSKGILPKDIFSKTIKLEFEGEKFDAPVGYDAYLKAYYGDYMQLPPIEKRVTHHEFKAWWK